MSKMKAHIQTWPSGDDNWFAGLRMNPRIHQWDEQELLFPTHRWIDVEADSPDEANVALEELIDLGLVQRHSGMESKNAIHVFAYALYQN